MEPRQLVQQKGISYGAYTAIPETSDWKKICIVKDKIINEETGEVTGESGWKLVGGKVEAGETCDRAARYEINEEVSLHMYDPEKFPLQVILIVHKTGRDETNPHHHAIFFESVGVPDTQAIVPGREIARAEWMDWETTRGMIWNREVVPQHAAAMLWLFTRELYFRGNERILKDTLSLFRHYWSYSVGRDNVLTICLDNTCGECEPRKFEMKNATLQDTPPARRVAPLTPAKTAEPTPAPKKQLGEGEVNIVFVLPTRMEDFVLLGPEKEGWQFSLPVHKDSSSLAQQVKAWTGEDKFTVVREKPGLVLVECARHVNGTMAVSLNDGENGLLSYENRRSIADALAVWPKGRSVNYSWRAPKWRPIPDKYLETVATRD